MRKYRPKVKRNLRGGLFSKRVSKKYWNKRGNQGRYARQAWNQKPDGPYSMKRKRYYPRSWK